MEKLTVIDEILDNWAQSKQHLIDANVFETEVGYVIHFNTAGIHRHNINCFVKDEYLIVQFERNQPLEGKLKLQEVNYGKHQRRVKLKHKCDVAQMKTHYENGIFQVLIPKLQ